MRRIIGWKVASDVDFSLGERPVSVIWERDGVCVTFWSPRLTNDTSRLPAVGPVDIHARLLYKVDSLRSVSRNSGRLTTCRRDKKFNFQVAAHIRQESD